VPNPNPSIVDLSADLPAFHPLQELRVYQDGSGAVWAKALLQLDPTAGKALSPNYGEVPTRPLPAYIAASWWKMPLLEAMSVPPVARYQTLGVTAATVGTPPVGAVAVGNGPKTLLGPIACTVSGDITSTLTLYDGNPNTTGVEIAVFSGVALIAGLNLQIGLSSNYSVGKQLTSQLYYTLTATTTAPHLVINYMDTP